MDILHSKLLHTVAATTPLILYVAYRDTQRYKNIADTFSTGNITEPMQQNHHEVAYFPRDNESGARLLRETIDSNFTNKYHLVMGEVGTGKTRLLVELVREKIRTSGVRHEGAPVYVLASQGKSFPDAFAAAINFKFDEHISLRFLINAIVQVEEFPRRDYHNKLARVLCALEKAAFRYTKEKGKPAVVIIDGVDRLTKHMPDALTLMQEKAKLWADANIVKLVLVTNDERTQEILQENDSNWSRADMDIYIRDMPDDSAREFLKLQPYGKSTNRQEAERLNEMSNEYLEKAIHAVGGRVTHLLEFKFDWLKGVGVDETIGRLVEKELAKFHSIAEDPANWKVKQLYF